MIRLANKAAGRWFVTCFHPYSTAMNTNTATIYGSSAYVHLLENARSYHASHVVLQPKEAVHVSIEKSDASQSQSQSTSVTDSKCGPVEEDDEMEQEEMFVTSDPSLGLGKIQEWGGPRRGGRLAEPTRFGDWERKGRCTDF